MGSIVLPASVCLSYTREASKVSNCFWLPAVEPLFCRERCCKMFLHKPFALFWKEMRVDDHLSCHDKKKDGRTSRQEHCCVLELDLELLGRTDRSLGRRILILSTLRNT